MLRTAPSLPLLQGFDAGLRPGPFPDQAASLLPGLLAPTRTGLPPAGDDELTNTKIHHGTTSRCHLPFYWAHEKPGLALNDVPEPVPGPGDVLLEGKGAGICQSRSQEASVI